MIALVLSAAEPPTLGQPPLWWTWVGGPAIIGAVLAGVIQAVNSVVTKKTKSPESIQSQVQTLLDGLQGMINLLSEDKARDNERIAKLQDRVDDLETLSEQDLDNRTRMNTEIQELKTEVARKDMHIHLLVVELKALGTTVTGLSTGTSHGIGFDRD